MPSDSSEEFAKLRKKIWVPVIMLSIISLAAWVVALAALGGKNLISSMPADSVKSLYLIAALAVTLVGIPIALLAVRNIQILLSRGVWTTATSNRSAPYPKAGIGR